MRKLNLPWLVGLVVSLIGLGALGFGLHEFQMRRNALSFIREAKRAQAENRFTDAAEYFRHYVKLVPNEPEGLILYGFQLADIDDVQVAYDALQKAIQLQPGRMDVYRRLAEIAIRLQRYSDAIDYLQTYLLKESPNDADLLEKLSICQFEKGEFKESERSLVSAIENSPDRLRNYLEIATLQQEKLNRAEEAFESINLMVDRNRDNFQAYLYRGQWRMRQVVKLTAEAKAGRPSSEVVKQLRDAIGDDAKQALKLAPDNADAIEFGAVVALDSGNRTEARKLALHGVEVGSSDSRFYKMLAEMESSSGDLSAAIEYLRRGVSVAPKDPNLKWTLANSLIDQGNFDEAQRNIDELRTTEFPASRIGYLEARIKFRRSDFSNAIRQFEAIRSSLADTLDLQKQVDYWLGLAYRETDSVDHQLTCFRRAVEADPEWTAARMALAESLVAVNLFPEAANEYRRVRSQSDAPKAAAIGLAKALLFANLRKLPKQQDWAEFDEVLNDIQQQGSMEVEVALLRMEQSRVKNDLEESATVIAAAREKSPDRFELWNAQIDLALTNRKWEFVEQLLEACETQFGDTPSVRLLRARYYVERYSKEATAHLRQLAEPAETWVAKERLQFATELIPLLLSIEDFEKAESLAATLIRAEPTNLKARLMLVDVAVQSKRPDLLEKALDEVGSVAGEGALWQYGQAIRLNWKGQETKDPKYYVEALSHLRKAQKERPTWEQIPLLIAEIQERQGEQRAATDKYLEAIRLGERTPAVTGRALSQLFNEKRFDEAEKLVLSLHASRSVFTDEMLRTEVMLWLQLDKTDQALKCLENVSRDSQEQQDPLWVAQAFAALKKYDQAEAQFRRAIQANSRDPKPWIGLVRLLVLAKRSEEAEAVIEQSKSAIAPDQVMLAVGQCYLFLDKLDLARKSYQAAMDQSSDRFVAQQTWADFLLNTGAASEAEEFLKGLLKSTVGTNQESREKRAWIHRRLAAALSARGGPEAITKALAVIQQNLDAIDANSVEDLRLKAMILSKRPLRADQLQAISILEMMIAQDPYSETVFEDRFLLSGLYQQTGDRPKARAELRKLVSASKDDARYLGAYVQLCLQSAEIGEAEIYLDRLQKIAPGEVRTLDLNAQLLFMSANYLQLSDLVKSIGAPDKRPGEEPEAFEARKLWAAKRFEEFASLLEQDRNTSTAAKFTAEADSFYTQFVRSRPREMLVYAEFLAKTVQIDRALELLRKHGAESPAGRFADVALAIRKNPASTSLQLTRLQELLRENVASHDNSIQLMLIAADLMSWREDYDGADNLYLEVLRRDGSNVAALNNLAVLKSMKGGDQTEALRMVQDALKVGYAMDTLLDTRGLVHLADGHPEKAIVDFAQAIAVSENAERRFHEALAFAQLRDPKSAQQSLDRAEAIGLQEHALYPAERTMLRKLRMQLRTNDRQGT